MSHAFIYHIPSGLHIARYPLSLNGSHSVLPIPLDVAEHDLVIRFPLFLYTYAARHR